MEFVRENSALGYLYPPSELCFLELMWGETLCCIWGWLKPTVGEMDRWKVGQTDAPLGGVRRVPFTVNVLYVV